MEVWLGLCTSRTAIGTSAMCKPSWSGVFCISQKLRITCDVKNSSSAVSLAISFRGIWIFFIAGAYMISRANVQLGGQNRKRLMGCAKRVATKRPRPSSCQLVKACQTLQSMACPTPPEPWLSWWKAVKDCSVRCGKKLPPVTGLGQEPKLSTWQLAIFFSNLQPNCRRK